MTTRKSSPGSGSKSSTGKAPSRRAAKPHPSCSAEQLAVEAAIISGVEKRFGIVLKTSHRIECGSHHVILDGYAETTDETFVVEAFARVGQLKSGQRRKMSRDMAKLALVETCLRSLDPNKRCRKILAVCHSGSKDYLSKSWDGDFCEAFGIEVEVIALNPKMEGDLISARVRQRR